RCLSTLTQDLPLWRCSTTGRARYGGTLPVSATCSPAIARVGDAESDPAPELARAATPDAGTPLHTPSPTTPTTNRPGPAAPPATSGPGPAPPWSPPCPDHSGLGLVGCSQHQVPVGLSRVVVRGCRVRRTARLGRPQVAVRGVEPLRRAVRAAHV